MPAQLTVDRLTTGYGRIEVLRQVSFEVPRGAVVALLGANGAGKTTALRAIGGTLRVWDGSVRMGRTRLNGRTAHAIARLGVGYVPEGRGIFPGLTVDEHIGIATRAARVDAPERAARRAEALEAFPALERRLGQRAGTMSGGEQQMLAMARALISRPKVLLLDEISMGLAPLIVDRLYAGVAQLKAAGVTILLVEQYLTHALSVADVCYVLAKGRVVFAGEPGELRSGDGRAVSMGLSGLPG